MDSSLFFTMSKKGWFYYLKSPIFAIASYASSGLMILVVDELNYMLPFSVRRSILAPIIILSFIALPSFVWAYQNLRLNKTIKFLPNFKSILSYSFVIIFLLFCNLFIVGELKRTTYDKNLIGFSIFFGLSMVVCFLSYLVLYLKKRKRKSEDLLDSL